MKKFLVCGSIAYDHIMEFPGKFSDSFLKEMLDHINVSFLVSSLKKLRGGTAPNIAYNLALVGEKPVVLGTAGMDFEPYREWLHKSGVLTDYIRILDSDFTASCFITTDQQGNQFTTFYPGAMAKDPDLTLSEMNSSEYHMAIIAPTEPMAMVRWVKDCKTIGLPYLYDPGMQIPRLSAEELIAGIEGAKILIFNEYEYQMLINKTNITDSEILKMVDVMVITEGEKGSTLKTRDEAVTIAAARAEHCENPTGAGDAYRAGLLKMFIEGRSIKEMGEMASTTAVYAVEHWGATEHSYNQEELLNRYKKNYGSAKD